MRSVNRSKLKEATYNPRHIDEEAKRRLRNVIKANGLVRPIVVNERTMHIVSGHQRIAILDSIERRKDYELDVAFVDLDEKTEREQNVFTNNEYAQGTFDLDKLSAVLKGVSFEKCGFMMGDLQFMLKDYERPLSPAAAEQLADVQRVTDEIASAPKAKKLTAAEMKQKRKEIRERMSLRQPEAVDVEFFTVLTFDTPKARNAFLDRFGIARSETCMSGVMVQEAIVRGMHGEGKEGQ